MLSDEILELQVEPIRFVAVQYFHRLLDQHCANGLRQFFPTRNDSRAETLDDVLFVLKID
jgi:hypothetical protein